MTFRMSSPPTKAPSADLLFPQTRMQNEDATPFFPLSQLVYYVPGIPVALVI